MDIVEHIESLFDRHGHLPHDGMATAEPGGAFGVGLSARAHALQCAQLAEWDEAPPAMVAAALLHDIGHLIEPHTAVDHGNDQHELRALGLLMSEFDAAVVEPIRLHVAAKRWLVSVDSGYLARLSPASQRALAMQGGVMSSAEREHFEGLAYSPMAITLRRWDDRAQQAGRRTPPLSYYLDVVALARKRPAPSLKLVAIGALDVA